MCRFYFIQTLLDICMKENINLKGVCDKTHISYHGFWGFNTFGIMRRTQHLLFSKAVPAENWSTSYPCDCIMSFAVNTAELGVLLLLGSEGRAQDAWRSHVGLGSCQGWKCCKSPRGRWDLSGGLWSLFLVLRGGVWCSVVLYCLHNHNFSQSWACCSSSCRPLLWKEVGSWVLLYFNHLMTLCPVQYQFVKVSGALHKIKSFDILHPSSKCNKNILSDLSQWHSAGENLSHGVWPSVLERHIKIIPPCYVVVLDSLKFQLGSCHLRAQRWMNGCKLQLVLG